MRRINISTYKWNTDGKGNPEAKVRELLSMPEVAILKRLATERLGVEADSFDAMVAEEVNKPEAAEQGMDYLVRDSIVEILFHPGLQLAAKDLLDRDTLARKIKDWPGDDLLLEEEEYKKVVSGMEALRGLGRHDVEFVKRILNAQTVEVQAKPALAAGSATPTK